MFDDRQVVDGVSPCGSRPANAWDFGRIPAPISDAAAQKPVEVSLPPIVDAATMLAEHTELPAELVVGVLHAGGKMVIGGGSKSFKTWLLSDLALAVATGTDWLGFPTTQGRVLYMNLEIQQAFFRKRLADICQAKGLILGAGLLDVWNLRGHAAEISTLITEVLKQVGQKYALIVVDPIYKALGGRDENKAGDIAGLLNELERLAVQSGAAVVFGAHFSKGNQAGKESMDRIGGSGVFARDPDSILVLTKHEEEDAFAVETTLRNHAPIPSFVVRWNFPLMHRDDSLNPAKLKQIGGRARQHTSSDLLSLFGDNPAMTSQWERLAVEQAGMSKSTFYRLFRELKAAGKVIESPTHHGRWTKAQAIKTVITAN